MTDLVDLVHGFFLAMGCSLWAFFCLAVVGGCRLRSGGRGRLLGCGYCGLWLWLLWFVVVASGATVEVISLKQDDPNKTPTPMEL